MSFDRTRLFELLPALYGQRDHEIGGPLGDLLGVLAEQIVVLEENLDQLYDDHFVETCAEWVVPYIGDLIGYRTLHTVSPTVGRARAEVAHTIDFRRRKGTLSVLEGLARDVTGWRCSAAEYFQRLITTQYMNHVRLHISAAPDLRDWLALEHVDTAFDRIPRTVDVRNIRSRRGRHNIPNIGLFAWRLQACSLRRSPAARVDTHRHRFHPLNIDQPLFTRPVNVAVNTELVGPLNVPGTISRRVLEVDLDALAQPAELYADTNLLQSLELHVDRDDGAGLVDVPRGEVCVCNLANVDPAGLAWAHPAPAGKIAIDPELGRIALPPEATDDWRVLVTFHYGGAADVGGGEYERAASFEDSTPAPPTREVPDDFPTIQQAIDDLGGAGLVIVNDSGRYEEALTIAVPAGARLEVRAANDVRPTIVLAGALQLTGGADSEVRLNGLLISGHRLAVPAAGNELARLQLSHCTLVPGWTLEPDLTPQSPAEPSLVIELPQFQSTLTRCITGALRVAEGAAVRAVDSAIDSTRPDGLAFAAPDETPGANLTLEGCTVIGRITAQRLPLVSNCILLSQSTAAGETPVRAERRQEGCVRFSWLPATSRTPRRHRCLPESAPDLRSTLPRFTALRYGAPGYLQLNVRSGARLMTGADDETEPGVYHHLANTWRETNLRVRLDEYLRVGLQAGIFYET